MSPWKLRRLARRKGVRYMEKHYYKLRVANWRHSIAGSILASPVAR